MKHLILSFLFIINLGFPQTNYSLSFDGSDDNVNVGNTSSLTISGDITVSAVEYIATKKLILLK